MRTVGTLTLVASGLLFATAAMATWVPVPELDPGSASLGVTLLVSGFLVLNGRRRKR